MLMSNKNAQEMSKEQVRELGIRMLSAMPLDMDKTTAQGWIQNPGALAKKIRVALMPQSDYHTEILKNFPNGKIFMMRYLDMS